MNTRKYNYMQIAKIAAIPAVGLMLIASAIFTFLSTQTVVYSFKTLPSQYVAGVKVGGLKEVELQQKLEVILDKSQEAQIPFKYEDKTFKLKSSDLNLKYSFTDTYSQIKSYEGQPTVWQLFKDSIKINKHKLQLDTDSSELEIGALASNFPGIQDAKNAHFIIKEGSIEIELAKSGLAIDKDILITNLKGFFNGDTRNVEIVVQESTPTVLAQDLEQQRSSIKEFISRPFALSSNGSTVSLDLATSPEIINFDKSLDGLVLKIDEVYLDDFIKDQLEPVVSKDPETVNITFENERAEFSGIGAPGQKIDQEKLQTELNSVLTKAFFNKESAFVEVPVIEIEPNFIIPQELKDRGVKELLAVGYTTYYGSPANRMHNIDIGVQQFNGVILPHNENFSFNTTLGEVDQSTGYLPELVIKGAETIPEYGGGLCQVSTTFYRAALFAGLEIVDRAPHSYAVGYYSQILGHGLDATIYPPFRDLVIKNNSPGDILMQSYTVGTEAYFRFFGTDTELEVKLEGPYLSNHRSTGAAETIVDESLEPGARKEVAQPHAGFDAVWYRVIKDKDGNITKEPINSRYRAVPGKVLVGPSIEQIN
jgi:vancomycin resistance protein YoaR